MKFKPFRMKKTLYSRVASAMSDGDENGFSTLRAILFLISLGYGKAVACRNWSYERGVFKIRKLPCFVISVGNIVAGGTGKTPLTIYLARLVKQLGYRVVVISRGYKARRTNSAGMVSNGTRLLMDVDAAGDEPYLMATRLGDIPVLIGKDRFQAGLLACKTIKPQVIILDDAFQHRKLARDMDLVLLDYKKPVGIGHLLPRGLLREGPPALGRADGIIFTRTDPEVLFCSPETQEAIGGKPTFKSVHRPFISKIITKGGDGEMHPTCGLCSFKG